MLNVWVYECMFLFLLLFVKTCRKISVPDNKNHLKFRHANAYVCTYMCRYARYIPLLDWWGSIQMQSSINSVTSDWDSICIQPGRERKDVGGGVRRINDLLFYLEDIISLFFSSSS